MRVDVWTQTMAPAEVLEAVERRRKAVFIDELGWDLLAMDGRERDQFDGPGALLLVSGGVFAMRVLPERRSMVRELWPEVAGQIVPGSFELSRWVSLSEAPRLRETRAAVQAMIAEFQRRGWWDMFSIATDRVAAAHGVMGMRPQQQTRVGDDINLCQWSLKR